MCRTFYQLVRISTPSLFFEMSTVKIDDTYINLPWVTGDPAKEEIRFYYEEMLSDDDGIVISSDDESVVLRPSVVDVKTEFENFDREKVSQK